MKQAAAQGDTGELIGLLESPGVRKEPGLRARIVEALVKLRDPNSVEALSRVVREDESRTVRGGALFALAKIGDRGSVPLFVEMLNGRDHNLRLRAIWGLASTRANEAVAPLIAALDDPKPSIRAAAARGLADIGDPMALPHLREAARRTKRPWLRARLRLAVARLEDQYPGQ
jgi:HEAT repeat protein